MSSALYHPTPVVGASSFSQNSNNAGLPLPFIPRRRFSMPSSQAIFSIPHPDPVAPHTNVESSKPSSQNSDKADDSSDTSESRRARRARSQRKIQPLSPLQPVVQPSHVSTFEFPRQGPAVTASGSAECLPPLTSTLDDPALTPDFTALISASPSVDGHIRKKSGEPLKSSLKSRPPTPRPNLSVVTTRQVSSKSEPATPNHMRSKSVSFAERLDHVKLFFAEQKPIAVSRDGSPTEDTSGTESEVPAPVRTIPPDDAKKRLLVMQVASMPQWTTMDVDVMLEDIALSKEATICGHVKVKNLAFQKSVAVRFTFDCWQTTSEVSAKYEQSLAHGAFDRFSFVIRLHDILSKIEDKTLFMAIRYAVNGQEIWDNNGGQDYKIKFSLPVPLRAPGTIAQIQYASDEEAVANLTQRLERVQSTEALKNTHRRRRSGGTDEDFFFNSSASLSSRYTWGASLKEPWKPTDLSSPSHSRPTTQPPSSSVFPWARKPSLSSQATQRARAVRSGDAIFTRGSPRLGDDNVTSGIVAHCHTPGDLPNDSVWRGALRNHTHVRQPSGLTDPGSPGGKMTRSVDDFISPRDKVGGNVDPGNPSVPVVEAPKFHVAGEIERISSDDSSSTSSSSQPSPVVIAPGPPSNDMMSIINRFCFYTSSGTETGTTAEFGDGGGVAGGMADIVTLDAPEDPLQRSYSTSSIEDILRHSQRSMQPTERQESPLKSRSSSCDDLVSFSGSPTPTLTPTKMQFKS